MSWGGDGSLNLPYEDVPGGPMDVHLTDAELSSGLVVLAAMLPKPNAASIPLRSKESPLAPVLILRFSRGDGTFYPDRVLVMEERELKALSRLVRDATNRAIDAAHRRGPQRPRI